MPQYSVREFDETSVRFRFPINYIAQKCVPLRQLIPSFDFNTIFFEKFSSSDRNPARGFGLRAGEGVSGLTQSIVNKRLVIQPALTVSVCVPKT